MIELTPIQNLKLRIVLNDLIANLKVEISLLSDGIKKIEVTPLYVERIKFIDTILEKLKG